MVVFKASLLRTVCNEIVYRNTAGNTCLAMITVWPIAEFAAATKTMPDQLIVYRHIHRDVRVRH